MCKVEVMAYNIVRRRLGISLVCTWCGLITQAIGGSNSCRASPRFASPWYAPRDRGPSGRVLGGGGRVQRRAVGPRSYGSWRKTRARCCDGDLERGVGLAGPLALKVAAAALPVGRTVTRPVVSRRKLCDCWWRWEWRREWLAVYPSSRQRSESCFVCYQQHFYQNRALCLRTRPANIPNGSCGRCR